MTPRLLAFAVFGLAFSTLAHSEQTAKQRFESLEALLARAGRFDVKAHVVSSGAVASDLSADVGVANAGIVAIRMHGMLNGKADDVVLRSDGVVTMLTKDGNSKQLQPGHAMREAMQIGFLRMGLWHNLMLLSQGAQPEHQAGDISRWVSVDAIRYATPSREGKTGLTFNVSIEGKNVGVATLWIDDKSQMPVSREQTLVLDGKKVQTVEDYSNFVPTA